MSDEEPIPMTDGEYFILTDDGFFILRKGVVIFGEAMIWGIYLVVMGLLVYRLTKRPTKDFKMPTPRKRVLIVMILMFFLSTAFLVLSMMRFVISVNIVNMAPLLDGQTYQDRIDNGIFADSVIFYTMSSIFSAQILLGDTIVLWRTFAVWENRPWALSVPCALWLIALVVDLIERIAFVLCYNWTRLEVRPEWCGPARNLNILGWALTMATNAVATGMIAHTAWKHRRLIKRSLGRNARRTLAERILALLIESGFLYLAWWCAMSTTLVDFKTWGFGMQFQQHMWYMGNQVVGLYPALIVVLVDFQKSVWYRPHVGAESQVDSRYGSQFHFSSTAGSRAVGVDLSSGSAGSSDYYTLTTIKQTSFGGSTN